MSMQGRLTGKRIVITGGTAGIGQGIALLAAREGANIAFCGHNQEGADSTPEAIEKAGGQGFFQALDLSDEEATRRFGQVSIGFLGGLDGLVNNAGANFWHGVAGASREQIEACLALNF